MAVPPRPAAPQQWWPWVAVAAGLQLFAVVPYVTSEVTVRYGPYEVLLLLVWQLGIIGGAMFRAGMVFAKQASGGPSPGAAPDQPGAAGPDGPAT